MRQQVLQDLVATKTIGAPPAPVIPAPPAPAADNDAAGAIVQLDAAIQK